MDKLEEIDKYKKDWWLSSEEALALGLITKIIEYDRESVDDTIKDMMTNKKAILGLNEEFAKNLEEFFVEYPAKRLPQGTIRIFNGAYDETGSSYVSFKSVMELIIDAFENFYNLNDDNYLKKLIEKF